MLEQPRKTEQPLTRGLADTTLSATLAPSVRAGHETGPAFVNEIYGDNWTDDNHYIENARPGSGISGSPTRTEPPANAINPKPTTSTASSGMTPHYYPGRAPPSPLCAA